MTQMLQNGETQNTSEKQPEDDRTFHVGRRYWITAPKPGKDKDTQLDKVTQDSGDQRVASPPWEGVFGATPKGGPNNSTVYYAYPVGTWPEPKWYVQDKCALLAYSKGGGTTYLQNTHFDEDEALVKYLKDVSEVLADTLSDATDALLTILDAVNGAGAPVSAATYNALDDVAGSVWGASDVASEFRDAIEQLSE